VVKSVLLIFLVLYVVGFFLSSFCVLCPMLSCPVPKIASVSELSILDCRFGFL
jgi:hypothetical protein